MKTHDRVFDVGGPELSAVRLDVLHPFVMIRKGARRQPDELDAALSELGREAGDFTKLGGADGGEVGRVREEDHPTVSGPLMELDGTLRGLCLKIGRDATETKTSWLRHFFRDGRSSR